MTLRPGPRQPSSLVSRTRLIGLDMELPFGIIGGRLSSCYLDMQRAGIHGRLREEPCMDRGLSWERRAQLDGQSQPVISTLPAGFGMSWCPTFPGVTPLF